MFSLVSDVHRFAFLWHSQAGHLTSDTTMERFCFLMLLRCSLITSTDFTLSIWSHPKVWLFWEINSVTQSHEYLDRNTQLVIYSTPWLVFISDEAVVKEVFRTKSVRAFTIPWRVSSPEPALENRLGDPYLPKNDKAGNSECGINACWANFCLEARAEWAVQPQECSQHLWLLEKGRTLQHSHLHNPTVASLLSAWIWAKVQCGP